ncbi:MAG: FlgD immunoglobulin-like domain containing protein [Candidatus Krumholzibacteriia bacterium]
MNPRYLIPLALVLAIALPCLAADADPLTGEPTPASLGSLAPVAPALPGDRDDALILLSHIADGTSKSVRPLPGNVVVWQNGAWLIASDLTSPAAPVELGRYLLTAQPSDMQVIGSTLYVALRKTSGLLILDYGDPTAPALVGSLEGYDLLSVAVQGDRAYCGRGSPGVLVVDLSDPTQPTAITTFDTPGSANGTDVDGDIVYVAMGTSGLGVYDVTDPLAPVFLATMPTSGFCTYVQQRDGVAYACDGSGLSLFDVSVPAAPTPLGTVNAGGSCYEMCFTGNPSVVFLAGLPGLLSVMVANPASPIVLNASSIGNAFSCADAGTAAVMASRYTGLHVFDGGFDQLANVPNAGFAMKLHLDGNELYVADLSGGVLVYDLTNPTAPVRLTEVPTDPNCQDVAIAGDILYAVNSNNTGTGLGLTDVSDPAAPVGLSIFDTANQSLGLDVVGDLCVVANGFGGLRTVNVADPLAPALLGDVAFGAAIYDVMLDGPVAYAISFGGGMLSVNLTDPASPILIQQQMWGFLNAVDITDQIAWVADGQEGLRVVDITDPANLTTLATLVVGGQTRDVVRSRTGSPYVYLADDFYGLRVVEVSDPAAPVLLGSFPSADRGMGVDARDGLVVLAAGETGVYVYRDASVVAIEPGDDDVTPELPQALGLTAAPNPFNPRVEIGYALPRAGSLRIDVFDARGRLVRTLLRSEAPAGTGSVIWDGTDRGGRAVASGVYNLRLSTEFSVASRQVTLVR